MAEKRLSGEEQRAKMKEMYKRDLQLRKQFLEDVKEHKRQKTLTDAVVEIASAKDKDDSEVWIEHLNKESALTEAKMEMALDTTSSGPSEQERLAMSDAEIRKLKAQELVNQMKAEMTGNVETPATKLEQKAPETPAAEQQTPPAPENPDGLPPRKMLDDI